MKGWGPEFRVASLLRALVEACSADMTYEASAGGWGSTSAAGTVHIHLGLSVGFGEFSVRPCALVSGRWRTGPEVTGPSSSRVRLCKLFPAHAGLRPGLGPGPAFLLLEGLGKAIRKQKL